jgi:hypothetical protein
MNGFEGMDTGPILKNLQSVSKDFKKQIDALLKQSQREYITICGNQVDRSTISGKYKVDGEPDKTEIEFNNGKPSRIFDEKPENINL